MILCKSCKRHVRDLECPFCGATNAPSKSTPMGRMSRAAIIALAATGKPFDCNPAPVAMYGAPPIMDASAPVMADASTPPVAVYGGPPVMPDASMPVPEDAGTTTDAAAPIPTRRAAPMYGLPPARPISDGGATVSAYGAPAPPKPKPSVEIGPLEKK